MRNITVMSATLYRETPMRSTMRNLLQMNMGRFIRVVFVKINGEVRHMTCKVTDNDPTRKYVTVLDVEIREYRRVNLDDIREVHINGLVLAVQ